MHHESGTGDLRGKFGEFLGGDPFRWNSFGTFTFSKPVRRGAIQRLDVVLWHVRGLVRGEPGYAFIAEERGPHGGRIHLHTLLEHPGVSCESIKRVWESRFGFARVKLYNAQLGAVHYLTKYVIKDACNMGDWALKTTCETDPDDDLFKRGTRRTGYELYSEWVRKTRGEGQ